MTGWFDILSLDKIKMKEDKAGLSDALRYHLTQCDSWVCGSAWASLIAVKKIICALHTG